MVVVDLGGKDFNGSLRPYFVARGSRYYSVDMEPDASVDVVVHAGMRLPFDTGSVDVVVSTSCFEHDPCFWVTIREMARITKVGGFIYINVPCEGAYHKCPGDNWRFFTDAAQALAAWSCEPLYTQQDVEAAVANSAALGDVMTKLQSQVYPLEVVEQFFVGPLSNSKWVDNVMIFRRRADAPPPPVPIVLDREATLGGPLCMMVYNLGYPVHRQFDVQ